MAKFLHDQGRHSSVSTAQALCTLKDQNDMYHMMTLGVNADVAQGCAGKSINFRKQSKDGSAPANAFEGGVADAQAHGCLLEADAKVTLQVLPRQQPVLLASGLGHAWRRHPHIVLLCGQFAAAPARNQVLLGAIHPTDLPCHTTGYQFILAHDHAELVCIASRY